MTTLPVKATNRGLVISEPGSAGRNPALVYIASLTTKDGRRAMRQALDRIALTISGGRGTAESLNWGGLRFEHTQAIRTLLLESSYKPATVNKALAALRGTLKAAWKMGLVTAEDYHRAGSVANVKGIPFRLAGTSQKAKSAP